MTLGGLDLDIGGVDARGRCLTHEEPHLVRPVQDVALDADAGQPGAGLRQRAEGLHDPAAVAAHVVAIHDPHEDAVRVRVEAVEDLAALVIEVGDDREPAVVLDMTTEASIEVSRGAIGRHRQLAGERQAFVSEPLDDPQLDVVPGDGHGASGRGRPDGDDVAHGVGSLQRDLQADHAAQGPAPHECEPPDAEGVGKPPDGPCLVACGRLREVGTPRLTGHGVDRGRPGGSVAAAQQVRAQHADPRRVESPAGPDERRPPVTRGVRGSGERVDDQHLRRVRPRPVVPVGDGQGQRGAALQGEGPEVGGLEPPGPEGEPGGVRAVPGSREDGASRDARVGWRHGAPTWRRPARPWTRSQRGGPGRGRRGCRRCARSRRTGG